MSFFSKWASATHGSARAYALRTSLMGAARKVIRLLLPIERMEASSRKMWEDYCAACLEIIDGRNVLDIGCGPGEQRSEVISLWHAARYSGVDLSFGMVRDAHRLCPESDFAAANACALPFKNESFDVVTSNFLFHHIPVDARRAALEEQLRVGKAVLLRDLHGLESGIVAALYKIYYTVFDGSEHRFTVREWHEFLAGLNARIVVEGVANPDLPLGRHCFFLLRRNSIA